MLKIIYYGSDIFYVLLLIFLFIFSYVPQTQCASVTTSSEGCCHALVIRQLPDENIHWNACHLICTMAKGKIHTNIIYMADEDSQPFIALLRHGQ